MLCTTRRAAHPYLLNHFRFPASGLGRIVWIAPKAKEFPAQASATAPRSQFVFEDIVDANLLTADDLTVVVSAQKVTRDFIAEWKQKVPANRHNDMLLVRRGTSLGSIDQAAAKDLGVRVVNTPGINSPHVAKFVVESLKLGDAATKGDAVKAVVVGAGSVGSHVVTMMNNAGVKPTIVELVPESLQDPSRQDDRDAYLKDQFGIDSSRASLSGTAGDAFRGATHIAFCCDAKPGNPILKPAGAEALMAGGDKNRKISIVCIARPDAVDIDALKMLPSDGSVNVNFDYGDAVLAPYREKVNADGKQEHIKWSSVAMNSEACKRDMDEAVLRLLNPKTPRFVELEETAPVVKNDTPRGNAACTPATLGTAGGLSAWMQAFEHLSAAPANRVVFFRAPGVGALWESSGRQLSVREKVTKFQTSVSAVLKNTHVKGRPETDGSIWPNFVDLGRTYVRENFSDNGHVKLRDDAAASMGAYRRVNEILEAVGEAPVYRETGRLVVAGVQEYSSAFDRIREWRRTRRMVDDESLEAHREFVGKSQAGRLFQQGYHAYGLKDGGFVVPDAETVLERGFVKHFGENRFTIVDSPLKLASSDGAGYLCTAGDTSEYAVGRLYLSPGMTHVIRRPPADGDDKKKNEEAAKKHVRLAPPVEITGHSGTVIQQLRTGDVPAVLKAASCSDFDEFFRTQPAAFMTDAFELTFESFELNSTDGGVSIRWRCTGNARVNAQVHPGSPEETLVRHVRRFLRGTITAEGFHACRRQVGRGLREELIDFGPRGKVALNWGHLGCTLAGMPIKF